MARNVYRQKLDEFAAETARSDEILEAAAQKDAKIFAGAGRGANLARIEAPNFTEAQRHVAALLPRQWAVARIFVEVDLAWRLKASAELAEEAKKIQAQIPKAEEELRKAQERLQHLRFQQNDALNEQRDMLGDFKGDAYRLAELTRGPNLEGLGRFLLQGPPSRRLGSEDMVHVSG